MLVLFSKMSVKAEPKDVCHVCNLKMDQFDLVLHYENEHSKKEDRNPKRFDCDICDKKFKTNESLRTHIGRSHENEKNNSDEGVEICDICDIWEVCVNFWTI